MEAAQTKPIRFNNHLLFWQKSIRKERRENKELYSRRHTMTDSMNKALDIKDYEVEIYEEEEEIEKNNSNRNKKKHLMHSAGKEECHMQTQNMLQRILGRLERLETQQSEPKKKVMKSQPNRS